MSAPRCTVPAPATSVARHGIGSPNAQSILSVGESQRKRARSARTRAGTASGGSSRR